MEVTTLVGNGNQESITIVDGDTTAARIFHGGGVAVKCSGATLEVFFMDGYYDRERRSSCIRKLAGGVLTTVAGSHTEIGNVDGLCADARFDFNRQPDGSLAIGPDGSIFVADTANHCIRKVVPGREVTTVAGSGKAGFVDGQGTAAQFDGPTGVAVDGEGIIFVADSGNHCIRKITPDGLVTTFAGGHGRGFVNGRGADARFAFPYRVAIDGEGGVVVVDSGNYAIRKISPSGEVTTLAGSGTCGSKDGQGEIAEFNLDCSFAVDGDGNAFVADMENCCIRKVTPLGAVTTVAGLADSSGHRDGQGASAKFVAPTSIAIDERGNLIVTDIIRIRSIAAGATPPRTTSNATPPSSIIANFASLLNDTKFADVVFQVGDETTTAHRAILVARCNYFYTMFSGSFTESQPGSDGKWVCRVEDTTMPALKLLLKHLYTDSLEDLPDEHAVQVMRLADRYGVERLLKHCLDARRITHSNAVPWLIQSEELGLEMLRKNAKRHVVENFGAIRTAKRQKFDLLSKHPELLMEVVHEIGPSNF
jgi:sugar lactone lactonase YvrE